jgi:CubicO group peptidase (beta-lactamase class C family)
MQVSLENFQSILDAGGSADLSAQLAGALSNNNGTAHIIVADRNRFAAISAAADGSAVGDQWLDLGCVSKLLAVTAFCSVFGCSRASLDATVGTLLGIDSGSWIAAITVKQLLNHTHGLDDPGAWLLPTLRDGRIDVSALLRDVAPQPLSRPGELHSYSPMGYWLLAAILERKTGESFLEVVRTALPGVLPEHREGHFLCPAYGRGVSANTAQVLVQLIRATAHSNAANLPLVHLGADLVERHRGWAPAEIGIANGWKAYRNGWFGHKSILPGKAPIELRVSPSYGIGFLVSSTGTSIWKVIRKVFSESLIETPAPPTPNWPAAGFVPLVGGQCAGVYDRLDSRIEILDTPTGMALTAVSKIPGAREGVVHSTKLEQISARMFVAVPAIPPLQLYFMEFFADDFGKVSHLWNTNRVWRKLE